MTHLPRRADPRTPGADAARPGVRGRLCRPGRPIWSAVSPQRHSTTRFRSSVCLGFCAVRRSSPRSAPSTARGLFYAARSHRAQPPLPSPPRLDVHRGPSASSRDRRDDRGACLCRFRCAVRARARRVARLLGRGRRQWGARHHHCVRPGFCRRHCDARFGARPGALGGLFIVVERRLPRLLRPRRSRRSGRPTRCRRRPPGRAPRPRRSRAFSEPPPPRSRPPRRSTTS